MRSISLLVLLALFACVFSAPLSQVISEPDSVPSTITTTTTVDTTTSDSDNEVAATSTGTPYHAQFSNAVVASFGTIIVSEIGDKTFFIAAILAMKHNRTMSPSLNRCLVVN